MLRRLRMYRYTAPLIEKSTAHGRKHKNNDAQLTDLEDVILSNELVH